MGLVTNHRVILVTLEVSSLPHHIKHIQLDPVFRAMSSQILNIGKVEMSQMLWTASTI